jgi:hypothetical protein
MNLERAFERLALLGARYRSRVLVNIAVVADLVPVLEDRLHRVGIALHGPGRHEERLREAKAAIGLKDARHADGRPVPSHRDRIEPVERVVRPGDVDQAVGVDVEGDRTGAARSVRPGDGVADHETILLP